MQIGNALEQAGIYAELVADNAEAVAAIKAKTGKDVNKQEAAKESEVKAESPEKKEEEKWKSLGF